MWCKWNDKFRTKNLLLSIHRHVNNSFFFYIIPALYTEVLAGEINISSVGGWMFLICPKLSECLYPTSPLVPLPPESPSDTRVISVVKFNYTYTNPRGTLQFYMNSDPDSAPPGRWQGLNTLPSPDGGHNNEMTGTKEHICNIQLVTQFTHNLTDDATQLVL